MAALAQGRFEIVRRVGAGGMGVVYEARDRTTGERLAIKTLHERDATALYRLKKEFRGQQHVTHRNLIQLRELFEEGGHWYLVMEFIEGRDALQYVRESREPAAVASTIDALTQTVQSVPPAGPATPPRDFERVRDVIVQIASALHHLHSSGRLHCDIKPANVLVDRAGRVVVVDLGLARVASDVGASTEGLAGTVPYLAPESVVGEPITAASDCYALGVLLFELLTGRLPFTGSAVQILHDKCSVDAPVELLPASTPRALRDICVELLQRDVTERPSASAVLQALGAGDPVARTSSSELHVAPRRFVGRDDELQQLQAAAADVHGGEARIVWVRGASGVGKSSLVRHFLDGLARSHEALTLASRCYEREDVPFKAIDGIVDALSSFLRTRSDAEVAALLPRYVAELVAAFPVLERVASVERAIAETQSRALGGDRRERAFGALRELMTRLSDRRMLTLWIDDLQWGDADSMRLLRELVRPPDAPRLFVILTSRDEVEVDTLVGDLEAAATSLVRLQLGALPQPDATELARVLARDAGLDGDTLAAEIGSEAKGHPLHILELVRHSSSFRGTSGSVRLDDALAARIKHLPSEHVQVLELVSVAAAPISAATLLYAGDFDSTRMVAATTSLMRANLIKAVAGPGLAYEPFHDRIREIMRSQLSASDQQRVHRQLVKALESGATPAPAELMMQHLAGCGLLDRAATYAKHAATDAEGRLAFIRAAELYRFALENANDGTDRLELASRLARSLAAAGRPLEAAHAYRAAVELANDVERVDLDRRCVEQLIYAGELDKGWAAARDLLRKVGVAVPEHPYRLIAALLTERARLKMRGLSFTPRREADLDAASLHRLEVLWSLSTGMAFVNPIASRVVQARFLREALAAGEPRRIAMACAMEGAYFGFRGQTGAPHVERVFAVAERLAREIDCRDVSGFVAGARGMCAYFFGEFTSALKLFESAAAMRENAEMQWLDGIRQTYRLGMLWLLGRYRELVSEHRELLRVAEQQGNVYNQRHLLSWRGNHAWLVQGDSVGARAAVSRAARIRVKGSHVQLPDYYDLLSNTMIDLYELDGATAFARVEDGWANVQRLSRVQTVDIESTYLRGCAALAASSGSRPAIKIARTSTTRLERIGTQYSRLLAGQLRAAIALDEGEQTVAIAALRGVIRDAREIGAHGHLSAAQIRLGAAQGEQGSADAEAAATSLRDRGVVDPMRFANMFTPGLIRA